MHELKYDDVVLDCTESMEYQRNQGSDGIRNREHKVT